MTKKYAYTLKEGKTVNETVELVKQYLSITKNMVVQEFTDVSGATCIQAKSRNSALKTIAGMNNALTVRLSEHNNSMVLEIGDAKWANKAVAVTTGSFIICWPLAVTGTIGAYSQYKLPKNVKGIVERYMAA